MLSVKSAVLTPNALRVETNLKIEKISIKEMDFEDKKREKLEKMSEFDEI